MQELAFLSLLPDALAERFPARGQSTPPLIIVYVSSLKVIGDVDWPLQIVPPEQLVVNRALSPS